jgi:DNA-binding response OmpR family regulator
MSGAQILLVEDDPRIVSFIARGLSAEGHSLVSLTTGDAAIRKARQASLFDVIILDLLLPDMHGHEVCHQIRKHHIMTPILMLTALDGIDDIVRGLDVGADDYLTKPFDFDVLLARIRSLRRRFSDYRGLMPSKLRLGELELDVETRRAHVREQMLDLTATEFRLLATLMQHPDKVLSRTEILELVWQTDQDPLTNIVDVYIRHLRRKIDGDLSMVAIETVRGHGYRITSRST